MVCVGIRVEGLAPSLTIENEMVIEGVLVFEEASLVDGMLDRHMMDARTFPHMEGDWSVDRLQMNEIVASP